MKLLVYGVPWAGGAPDPYKVLVEYTSGTITTIKNLDERTAQHYEVEITDEELVSLMTQDKFDVLKMANPNCLYLAFDQRGGKFRQR